MKQRFLLSVFVLCALLAQANPAAGREEMAAEDGLQLSRKLTDPSLPPAPRQKPAPAVRLPLLGPDLLLKPEPRFAHARALLARTAPTSGPEESPATAAPPTGLPADLPADLLTDLPRAALIGGGGVVGAGALLWLVGWLYRRRRGTRPESEGPEPVERRFCCLHASQVPLLGRQEFLEQLDQSLADPELAVVACIAEAGVGKSALVEGWLEHLKPRFGGARKVFAWSFQHTAIAQPYAMGGGPSSSGLFFTQALPFFGHEGSLPNSEEKRAHRLCELLRAQPSLLVLDGVDPLQHPPHARSSHLVDHCADPGLYHLLRGMCHPSAEQRRSHAGTLILLTSRRPVLGLVEEPGGLSDHSRMDDAVSPLREILLEPLTAQEGLQLFKALGVSGKQVRHLPTLVDGCRGHALTIRFLAGLLTQKRLEWQTTVEEIHPMLAPGRLGEHLQRVLEHYDRRIWPKDGPHGRYLRLFGLFDRSMREPEWRAVRDGARIAQTLKGVETAVRAEMICDLEQAGFLLPYAELCGWQLHPTVRDYFTQRLEEECAVWEADVEEGAPAWENPLCQAHGVLFDHFRSVLDEERPDRLEALEPLYRAVQHGCRAGRYKEALYEVYVRRIRRGADYFSLAQFGAYSSELTALAGFFPNGWNAPPAQADLTPGDRAWLLAEASFCLTAMGRLEEALGPQEQGMLLEMQRGAAKGGARAAAALCDLQLATGRLRAALTTAERGKLWAKEHKLPTLHWLLSVKQATALHRLDEWSAGLPVFQETEGVQVPVTTESLRFLGAARKAQMDLLLERQLLPLEGLLARAEQLRRQAKTARHSLWITLSTLSKCRILAAMGRGEALLPSLATAVKVTTAREGDGPLLAEILYHRASLLRQQGEMAAACQDLAKVLEIAHRWSLPLLEVDGGLLEGEMLLDQQRPEEAKARLLRAEALIAHTGYAQRHEAASALRSRLAALPQRGSLSEEAQLDNASSDQP
ncbi:MAG: hypothetical protein H7837_04545 [Magnetococcus sp. MYC-9]